MRFKYGDETSETYSIWNQAHEDKQGLGKTFYEAKQPIR